jgi:hypothetical protein
VYSKENDEFEIATQLVNAVFYCQSLNPITNMQVGAMFERFTATLERLGLPAETRNRLRELCIKEYGKRVI